MWDVCVDSRGGRPICYVLGMSSARNEGADHPHRYQTRKQTTRNIRSDRQGAYRFLDRERSLHSGRNDILIANLTNMH